MNQKLVHNIIISIISIAAIGSLAWWVKYDPTPDLIPSLPGLDNRGKGVVIEENINIGEHFDFFSEEYEQLNESWPRFRGEEIDNISKSNISLIDEFGAKDPKILWSLDLGEGHSGAAIYKGLAYFLDYNEELRADVLRCHALKTGEELWRRWYKVNIKRNHGMSRTVPAVTKDFIVTMGPRCHVMCVNREDGDFRWGIDIEKEYHSEVPFWYTGQCPLIDNGSAIIATGGDAILISVDCKTGEIKWKAPNPNRWKMSHTSVIPFTFHGKKMYVYSAIGGLCGVAADGSDAGTILWETNDWNHAVVAPSPVCMPDGKIYLAAGYGAGAMMVQLTENNGKFSVEVLEEYKPNLGLASEQQTPIYFDGHLFGVLPKDAGPLRNQFVCVHPSDPKKIVWSSGKEARFGLGPYFIADNKFFVLSDDAVLTILKPTTKGYQQMGQAKIIENGHDAWAPLAVANGYMILRDSKKMVCLDMRNE